MNILDFYSQLAKSVRYQQQTTDWLDTLQTFAVLRDLSEVNSENLGKVMKDQDQQFFYSRQWSELSKHPAKISFRYPALFAVPLSAGASNLFAPTKSKEINVIQLAALYPNIQKQENTLRGYKTLRPLEIYPRMAKLLFDSVHYLRQAVLATTNVNPTPTWYHKEELAFYQADGQIIDFNIDLKNTNLFLKSIQHANPENEGGFIDDIGKDYLCGFAVNIRFENDCYAEVQQLDFSRAECPVKL